MKNQLLSLKAGIVLLFAGSSYGANFYVDLNSANPTPPYATWDTAATNIQDAVDVASDGDSIFVTNGVYASGQTVMYGQLTNRVTIDKAVTVLSVNGPAVTIIEGSNVFTNPVRCVYLTNGATLSGFTLTNGGTGNFGTGISAFGGGAWCETNGAEILSNCIVTENTAWMGGGGVDGGTLFNCTLSSNHVSTVGSGGGASLCTLSNCTLVGNSANEGGGAVGCILENCSLSGNTARVDGGGAAGCTLTGCVVATNSTVILAAGTGGGLSDCTATNCLIVGNSGPHGGGGAFGGTLINCTVVGNLGSGTYQSTLANCIIYYNTGTNYVFDFANSIDYCCTVPPVPSGFGIGNIATPPNFLDLAGGDFHLQTNSPCINSGLNSEVSAVTDLDGNPRIQGGTVDIGAYEYQTPGSVISYDWLDEYGLPLNGSADFSDLDGTGLTDYQKWIANLNPTNSASVLAMLPPYFNTSAGGLVVTWQSSSNRVYYLERATNLAVQPAFSVIQTNLYGSLAGIGIFVDTNALGAGPYFYRVSVQR